MFGKFFASTFTGSMMAAGAEVFAVWAYVIAHAVESRVELNARLLSVVIGAPIEAIEGAIEKLCAPDPHSRSAEHEGRRLIKEGQYQYFVTGHQRYRSIRDEEDRREYNRIKQRESRAKKASAQRQTMSNTMSSVSANTEAEAEEDKRTPKPPKVGGAVGFDAFWSAWPKSSRKGAKGECEKLWVKTGCDSCSETIMAHVQAMSESDGWRKQNGEFIPAPLVYIRQRRWEGAMDGPGSHSSAFAGAI